MGRDDPRIEPLSNAIGSMSNGGLTPRPYVGTVLNEPHQTSHTTDLDSTLAMTSPERRARCSDGAGTLAHLFFSDEDLDIARAKAICRTCTLSATCFENAIARNEAYGVWGGTLIIDGEPVRFARRRGRPPVHRIETVADPVVIPDHLVA